MSANVDQRSKGQPNQVSNGSGGKDVMKEDDPYLQAPMHSMRSWSEQTSDNAYGAPPMSTAGVSDSFFQNYYPSNMTYPFMSQGIGGSEGPWSNGADTMFGMGYDYSSMYGGFGFPPFNNWEYASEYWGAPSSQPQRKDQRGGYPPQHEEAYYQPDMMPPDTYGMMANGVAAQVPPQQEAQEPIGTVEHGLRGMSLGGGPGPMQQPPASSAPSNSTMIDSGRRKMDMSHHQHMGPAIADAGFGGHHHSDPSAHMMMQQPPPMIHSNSQQHQASMMGTLPSSMVNSGVSMSNANSSSVGGSVSTSSYSQPKKTSWAAIASQPARTQQQLRPRTIPRAPVNPNKPHNMDIGTWDGRGGSSVAGKLPMQPLQPPPSVVSQVPPPPRAAQSWAASTAPPPRAMRQVGAPPSTSPPSIMANTNNSSNGGGSNMNASGAGSNGSNSAPSPSGQAGQGSYSHYATSGSGSANSGHSGGSNAGASGNEGSTVNGSSHMSEGSSRDNQQASAGPSSTSNNAASYGSGSSNKEMPDRVLDAIKNNLYNPKEFNLNSKSARFFIIKSYSEDDIHRSIKYNIWCSTEHGNKRLDAAFREREGKGPVYLIYSVNGSGHFCGLAQMMSPVDYNKSAGVWAQDKWKGQFTVKWVYVKDVPNSQLRHIRLENNENKPVTNSRDTQEVPPEKGKQVLHILHGYKHITSIFDDFVHYEKRQMAGSSHSSGSQSQQSNHNQYRGGNGDHRNDHRDHRNDYRNDHRGDHRGEHHGDHRGDGYGGRNNHRDNRRGGFGAVGRQDHGGHHRGHEHGGHHDNGGRGGRHH